MMEKIRNNTYFQLFIEFFTLGLFTFGGGVVMISTLQKSMEKKKWMSTEEILDCIALSQSLPGVVACNMACFVGYKRKGISGAVLSDVAIVLPSFVIIVAIAVFLDTVSGNIYVDGALMGIRAAATGLILYTVIKMAVQRMKLAAKGEKPFYMVMMIAAFLVIAIFDMNVVVVIISSIIIGIVYFRYMNGKVREAKKDDIH